MDHGTMTMGGTATSTAGAAAATTSAASMSMAMGGCKISMLWNWTTIDACFISSTWKITSAGMFAGSCIGVILLVMSLEMLRRATKEYDRFLIRQHTNANAATASATPLADAESHNGSSKGAGATTTACATPVAPFKPNILQQAIRAGLHMVQFAVAYFIMLLAMYYNGYIIICIFIGSYIGYFIFGWETLVGGNNGRTSAANEATVCCG